MIERCDGADHAKQRLTQRIDLALFAMRSQVAGKHLAVVAQSRIAGEDKHVAGPPDLVQRILLADAAFGGDEIGDLDGARANELGRFVANLVTVVTRQLGAEAFGDGKGSPDMLDAGFWHGPP